MTPRPEPGFHGAPREVPPAPSDSSAHSAGAGEPDHAPHHGDPARFLGDQLPSPGPEHPAPSPQEPPSAPVSAGPETTGDPLPLPDLAGVMAERDDYLASLQRLQADFANYKKRVTRLQQEQSERAASSLVAKVLPVLDTLDLALAHLGAPDAPEQPQGPQAIEQVRRQLLEVLEKEGLERVDQVHVAFDPLVHDAVARDHDTNDAEVAQVLRAGYLWHGQVLRPAMVRVRG